MDLSSDGSRKRRRSRSPPASGNGWQRQQQQHEYRQQSTEPTSSRGRGLQNQQNHHALNRGRGGYQHQQQQQQKQQQQGRADREAQEWVDREDAFVLKQAKKKAEIRVREGRAKPIDRLAVLLAIVDPDTESILEDDGTGTGSSGSEIELSDPNAMISGLVGERDAVRQLRQDIETYLALEQPRSHRRFWTAAKRVCQAILHRESVAAAAASASAATKASLQVAPAGPRGVGSVAEDIARLLGPKTRRELDTLEDQVQRKLRSDEAIDTDYWDHLLDSVRYYKARIDLQTLYQQALDAMLAVKKPEQLAAAEQLRARLRERLSDAKPIIEAHRARNENGGAGGNADTVEDTIDPPPRLKLSAADRGLQVISEADFLAANAEHRAQVRARGFHIGSGYSRSISDVSRPVSVVVSYGGPKSAEGHGGAAEAAHQSSTNAMYDREAARGFDEDEEAFAAEEQVSSMSSGQRRGGQHPNAGSQVPVQNMRRPKYFNRVQLGYEWNKYNQTHYDQDNPPPKVVQGYKFNVFYPELADMTKAPTYRIERENGRKRGQSSTAKPAGQEQQDETCVIRFMSGPPYEDIAFRIVDKEWDYSSRRERGFRSSFDKGILQLHFQFKKVYYRK